MIVSRRVWRVVSQPPRTGDASSPPSASNARSSTLISRIPRFAHLSSLSLFTLLLWACGGTDQAAPVPASLTIVSGDGQSAVVGTLLGTSLTVRVVDDMGDPVAGFSVSWSATSGGGSVSQTPTSTAANGQASTEWTLGGTAGVQTVTASGGGFSASFSATGEPGEAAQLSVTAAASTLDALGATTQVVGTVQDAFGNALPGGVTWASADNTVVTVDADGVVTAVANGEADVSGTSGTLTGSATLTVAQAAATVSITPANPVTSIGGTVQLSGSAEDTNGNPIADASIAWSSGSESIATVDGDGLVSGVAEGQAEITATSGTASGTTTATVTAAPFEPTSDVTIDGDLSAATITIPAGVTATLTGDATLSSAGDITIAGTLAGDCTALTVAAGGDLTITGPVTNECSDSTAAPRDLALTAVGAIALSEIELSSNGDIFVGNTGSASGASPSSARAMRAAGQTSDCVHTNIQVVGRYNRPGADGSPHGSNGSNGKNIRFACTGNMSFEGGWISPQGGSKGGEGTSTNGDEALGGNGGNGGVLTLVAQEIFFREYTGTEHPNGGTRVKLAVSSGGPGGDARATGEDAVARGGNGGEPGFPRIVGSVHIASQDALELYAASGFLGYLGGLGGKGIARGGAGADATATTEAEKGRSAVAYGGSGGRVGGAEGVHLFRDVFTGTVGSPEFLKLSFDEDELPGGGGSGAAGGGNGGSGSEQFPGGGRGGDTEAYGGDAGEHNFYDDRTGMRIGGANGSRGGSADLGISGIRFTGTGGAGWSDCRVGNLVPGGVGGRGATGIANLGQHTPGMPVEFEPRFLITTWGNGGNGGNGAGPGAGGEAGITLGGITHPQAIIDIHTPSLAPGSPGGVCATAIDPAVSVSEDKNGHTPFIALAPSSLTVSLGTNGAITISGDGNWITVTGTVDADGAFTAVGSGMAAGFSGVAVSFEGTLTLDSEGRVAGIASGTLTMDVNNNVFPPDANGNRNPAIYSISGAIGGG